MISNFAVILIIILGTNHRVVINKRIIYFIYGWSVSILIGINIKQVLNILIYYKCDTITILVIFFPISEKVLITIYWIKDTIISPRV